MLLQIPCKKIIYHFKCLT